MKYLLNEWNENYFLKYTEQNYLYEGLIVSYDIDTACYLLEEFNKTSNLLKDIGVESYGILAGPDKTPYVSFFIDEEDYIKTKTDDYMSQKFFELKQLINKMGYFIAQLKEASRPLPDGSKVKSNYCAIHPKFFVEISNAVYNKLDGILYHITLTRNWKKIEQKGFIPKNSHANMDEYPDRIFFFTQLQPDDFKTMISQFVEYRREHTAKLIREAKKKYAEGKLKKEKLDYIFAHAFDYLDWTIVKVELKKNREDRYNGIERYRFFDDPKSSGIFTYENIDPVCLSFYKRIQIE